MGDMGNRNAQHELGVRMEHMKADIVCIQETHNTETEENDIGDYRYISIGARKNNNEKNEKGTGGVAIMVKKEWSRNITKITRRSHRRIQMTMTTGSPGKELQVLNTYSPHMGYRKEQRDERWNEVKNTMRTIKKGHPNMDNRQQWTNRQTDGRK